MNLLERSLSHPSTVQHTPRYLGPVRSGWRRALGRLAHGSDPEYVARAVVDRTNAFRAEQGKAPSSRGCARTSMRFSKFVMLPDSRSLQVCAFSRFCLGSGLLAVLFSRYGKAEEQTPLLCALARTLPVCPVISLVWPARALVMCSAVV